MVTVNKGQFLQRVGSASCKEMLGKCSDSGNVEKLNGPIRDRREQKEKCFVFKCSVVGDKKNSISQECNE